MVNDLTIKDRFALWLMIIVNKLFGENKWKRKK